MKVIFLKLNLYYIVLCFVLLIGIKIITPVNDPDFFWHFATGQFILENKFIPNTDIYSWYGGENSLEWISHEWLSQLFFYSVYHYLGSFIFALIPFFAFLLLIYINFHLRKSCLRGSRPITFMWMCVFALFSSTCLVMRPQIFSILMFSLEYYLIYTYIVKRKKKYLYYIPIIAVLWSNLHGGSAVLCYTLLFITIISYSFNFKYGRLYSKKDIKILKDISMIMLVSIMAIFINPHGYKIFMYPFVSLKNNFMLNNISEWGGIGAQDGNLVLNIGILLTPFIILLISKKKIRLFSFLPLIIFAIQSISRARFLEYYFILATPLMISFPIIKNNLNNINFIKKFLLSTFVIYSSLFGIVQSYIIYKTFLNPIDESIYPEKSVYIIKSLKPKRMYNEFEWGGYAIWKLRKENIPVFIDGRLELFSDNIFVDYLNISSGLGVEESLKKLEIDVLWIRKDYPLDFYMKTQSNWIQIYEDENTSIYHKETKKS